MASVKFNLKYKDKETSPIFMCVYYGAFKKATNQTTGKEYQKTVYLKYYISESVAVKYWLPKICRVQPTKAYPSGRMLNIRLADIELKTIEIIRELQVNGITLSNDIIRKKLDEILNSHKDQTDIIKSDFFGFINYFIETSTRQNSTKKQYKVVLNELQAYDKEKNLKLSFDRINVDFHNEYINYLQAKKYAPNTIGTRIKILKTFMNEAYERGLHNSLDFKKKIFVKPKEETKSIYLTDMELERLYKLDLSKNTKYNNVRDWFIIASYTGLRFSDFSRLTKDNISNNIITIKTAKTGTVVEIPLHTMVKSILEKYKYNLPKVISNQKFNEYIKEVCKMANINDDILVNETKGITHTSRNENKHSLVSAHTARRSFATNAFLAGVPPIQIMRITGHKSEKVFLGYIKISNTENAKKLQMHPFFNKMNTK